MLRKLSILKTLSSAMLLLSLAGCGGAEPDGESEDSESALSSRRPIWVPLGGNLNPNPAKEVETPRLLAAPLLNPVIGFSAADDSSEYRTTVSRWVGNHFMPLGEAQKPTGSAVAVDSRRRIYLCTAGPTAKEGPFVKRWSGSRWTALGGDILREIGSAPSPRYSAGSCSDMVIDSHDQPRVTWSFYAGPKAHGIYVAGWSAGRGKWEPVGTEGIPVRGVATSLAIDDRDRLYLSAFSFGGSYGGGATTSVWRWSGKDFEPLGEARRDTGSPVLAVHDNTPYLAFETEEPGHITGRGPIQVLKWRRDAWLALPSPGDGGALVLDFTPSGSPVLAYLDSAPPETIRVKSLLRETWQEAGRGVAMVGNTFGGLHMRVDARGRPVVAWRVWDEDLSAARSLFAARYSRPLP
jgi:hypothetical protein